MNLKIGSQQMNDVQIPVLWGSRAVIQDGQGRLSVIDLSGSEARLEILGDEPAPGIEFRLGTEEFSIFANGEMLYSYNRSTKTLRSIRLNLPDCEVSRWRIRVGSNELVNNVISGFGVGVLVTEQGTSIGAPVPPELAKLAI